jgi:hypothetical protein
MCSWQIRIVVCFRQLSISVADLNWNKAYLSFGMRDKFDVRSIHHSTVRTAVGIGKPGGALATCSSCRPDRPWSFNEAARRAEM